ncbi:DUF2637 domain-containing protein [Leucobacter coleopterorum]|uniref:DUF2637 domain-containing protein n=1 Tax=Leucobacter coleopterorum TaxID=2714933 RepID=A0ABX6JZL3_9MICO|nr:DUF2637 domain-containing protein [Leucobacter coleopterorum]QIM19751.1 DUF2637 domain-containing protein [Leucobacter coleopterorum]
MCSGIRAAVCAAEVGTVLLAAAAFVLSFTTLRDLAQRAGVETGLAWLWPLIVDGIIVVSTVSVFALAGTRVVWYPWLLLVAGSSVSVTANAIHAVVAAEPGVPPLLAEAVAAVPPIVLVASTHLTAILIRHSRTVYTAASHNHLPENEEPAPAPQTSDPQPPVSHQIPNLSLIRPSKKQRPLVLPRLCRNRQRLTQRCGAKSPLSCVSKV